LRLSTLKHLRTQKRKCDTVCCGPRCQARFHIWYTAWVWQTYYKAARPALGPSKPPI